MATSHSEEIIRIEGGYPLRGDVRVIGAKNAALPAIAAACLSQTPTTLHNLPTTLKDIELLFTLLRQAGAKIDMLDATTVRIDGTGWYGGKMDADKTSKLRHSLLLLGVSGYFGAPLSLGQSGGCNIGSRKHDLHVLAFKDFGFSVIDTDTALSIKGHARKCNEIQTIFHYPSFGATLNFLYIAVGRPGVSILRQAALDPEVVDTANLLKAMGARIDWVNERDLWVEGGVMLNGIDYNILGDRIVAATFIAAAGVTRGEITVHGVNAHYLKNEIGVWRQAGLDVVHQGDSITSKYIQPLIGVEIRTAAYPAFHTDIQPLHGALMATAVGESRIIETVVDDRFKYCEQLNKLGAIIRVVQGNFSCVNGASGSVAIFTGVNKLKGTEVITTDIRGAAAVVLGGMGAEGVTSISNLYPLDRGYTGLEAQLRQLGAHIIRVK